jgi:hypothetical protein
VDQATAVDTERDAPLAKHSRLQRFKSQEAFAARENERLTAEQVKTS